MHTNTVLIIYSSRHGHTARIAHRLRDALLAGGVAVVDSPVADAGALDPARFDGVVVGGSVHMDHHDGALLDWVRAHRHTLCGRPTGFFSVSLTAATDLEAARRYVDVFVEDTDWMPRRTVSLAGALQYPAYGFATRQMVRQIARHKGLSTDVSRETAYTDWDELDRFARRLQEDLDRAAATEQACGFPTVRSTALAG